MDQEPKITPTPLEQGPKILSFEEFSDRTKYFPSTIPRYNNFFLFFLTGPLPDLYRKQKFFLKFATEHPEINKSLFDKMKGGIGESVESLKPFDRDLYEAYKIMKSYGLSDTDLFA